MNLYFIKSGGGGFEVEWPEKIMPELEKLGHTMVHHQDSADALIVPSIFSADDARWVLPNSHKPYYVMNWDLYPKFVARGTYPWDLFAEIMKGAAEVWAPSNEVIVRMNALYGLKNGHVIKSYARLFQHGTRDDRFILNAVRNYDWDPQHGWLEKACEELNIPLKTPNHQLSEEEYQDTVASCSFIVCPYVEASTGGLSLIEAHAIGKPVLVCDSPFMGAGDYFGPRASYFKEGNYDDFRSQLEKLWRDPPALDRADCWSWAQEFTPERMARDVHARLILTR